MFRAEQATQATASRPTAAANLWADLDREVVDEAVAVPLANQSNVQLVSERTGNVQIHPVWVPMYGQMWVRERQGRERGARAIGLTGSSAVVKRRAGPTEGGALLGETPRQGSSAAATAMPPSSSPRMSASTQ